MLRNAPLAALPFVCWLALAAPSIGASGRDLAASFACGEAANVRHLTYVTNSRDGGFQCLGITLARDAITGVRVENHSEESGKTGVRITDYPVALIESDGGAVLDGRPGHDAIILHGRFDRPSTRAQLTIRYLYNGITSEYRECPASIDRDPGGEWRLLNARHENVSRIDVETRSLPLLGVMGIETLAGVCVG